MQIWRLRSINIINSMVTALQGSLPSRCCYLADMNTLWGLLSTYIMVVPELRPSYLPNIYPDSMDKLHE